MIPKIVKGRGISGAMQYALSEGFAEDKEQGNANDNRERGRYKTLAEGEQSRVTILGGQNFGFDIDTPERLDLARRVMEWQALPENQGSKTRTQDLDCLHASLSWQPGYQPTKFEMMQAGTEFLKAIGLEKARAVFVAHDDTDHAHIHVVASRIDPETGKTLRKDYDKAAAQEWALDWEQAHGQERLGGKELHALREAVQARDVDAVLSHMTRDRSTFEPWQLNRALQYGGLRGEAVADFRAEIIGDKNTLGLRDEAQGPVTRYTTRQVLADEMAVLRTADRLATDKGHALSETRVAEVGARFTLQPEQAGALAHLTGPEGFAILWGEAGTGKSHTLNAARAAYSEAGHDVRGLSWTNDVVQQMRGDGFQKAATITSELNGIDKGRTAWTKNTVVIVDEAAMVSNASLARLKTAAADAGAKLIIAGDDAQLPSIERGGMFETLRQKHGAAILSDVQRVASAEQKAAFNEMHKGEFAEALQTFDKAGGVHWAKKPSDALKDMAARYSKDVAADPSKVRFMFAYTNADVRDLNVQARALHKKRGDLGRDHELQSKHGLQAFAEGDRIQFTDNARKQRDKNAGLTNGRVGTVEGITYDERDRAHVAVRLDSKKGVEPQRVTFAVGEDAKAGEFNSFKHGYAGTIYRGQGRTLDQTYIAHSTHLKAAAAYVALTRHREQVHIFAARDTVKDLDAMAKAMGRREGKRAATAYVLDAQSALKLDFGDVGRVAAAAELPAIQSSRGLDRVQVIRENEQRQPPAMPAPSLTTVRRGLLNTLATAAKDFVAQARAPAQDAAQRQQQDAARSLGKSADAARGPAQPEETAKSRAVTAKAEDKGAGVSDRRTAMLKAEAAHREQRKSAIQELTRLFGREVNEQEGKEITRDRGGGQSL